MNHRQCMDQDDEDSLFPLGKDGDEEQENEGEKDTGRQGKDKKNK